ncbi:MAG: hypothetical protein ABR968_05020 [Bacteroidales bacterium]|jgi:hypothetical protein
MKKLILLLACFIAITSIYAQKQKVELKLTLRDGNVITGTSNSVTSVLLNTAYGKLDIPIKNVSSLTFGITPDDGSKTKVINLIKQMNDPADDKRQAAYDELVKMSIGTIPVISDYIYGKDYQAGEYTDFTPEGALTELKSTYGVEENFSDKDVATIDFDYTMGGTFNLKSVDLKTEYGDLNVPKDKIKQMDISVYDEQSGEKIFKVMANKNISGNTDGGWLNTGIKIKTGQKLSINASGEVVLQSLSGNKYNPDGAANSTSTTSEYASTYPTYGNLVYKIGESGETVKAGSKYNGTVKESGTLYLAIYETVYNATNTGSYSVKISIK